MSYKYFIPALLWAMAIFIIIAIPGSYIPKAHGFLELLSPDKVIHLGMFAPLGYLIARGIFKSGIRLQAALFGAMVIGTIYASCTELLQYFVITGRNGNIFDAIADIIGLGLGIFLFNKIRK